jgi:hypothetical protein
METISSCLSACLDDVGELTSDPDYDASLILTDWILLSLLIISIYRKNYMIRTLIYSSWYNIAKDAG